MEVLYCVKYYPDGQKLCHLVKDGDEKAIKLIAKSMSKLVPKDVVLVPIPSRFGYANVTLDIAMEISKLTGCEIENILSGKSRQSNYDAKKNGNPLSVDDLAFVASELPSKTPLFIDNVYDTGVTMESAYKACNNTGIALVYAKV